MSLVENPIDSLYNGVSQQPAAVRLPSQAEAQVNGYSSVADGLSKRPPTEYLAQISATTLADAFIHIINRDSAEQYAVIVTDENLQVFDLSDGTEETVTEEPIDGTWAVATAYAVGDVVRPVTPNKLLFRCTIAGTSHASTEPTWDTTIGNTTADNTVTWETIDNYLAIPAGAKASESFEIVTIADYSFLVNKTKTVRTRTTGVAAHPRFNQWFFPDNWKLRSDGSRYYLPTEGTNGGALQTMSDLPVASDSVPPDELDYYEITGDGSDGFTSYYVIYVSGVWTETHQRLTSITLDEATMPHALIRETDTNFHLRHFGWVPRLVGDADTNPEPSFVGKEITSIGYNKNRLTVSAGENVVFSGHGDYGSYFRKTVTQLLADDVVDIAVSTQSVAVINHILSAQNGLMFFSDQTQFVLNIEDLLTPSAGSIDVATSYDMNPTVKPIAVGQDVYFVTETGNFSRVREYRLISGDEISTDATDITAHVGKYLPSGVFRLAGNSNEDLILALSDKTGHENRIYVYKFFYNGEEKIQSAWSYWEFAADDVILDVSILNNLVYFIVERADGVYLESMNVQSTDFPLALTYDLLIDRRHNFTGGQKSFDSTFTTFTLPYEITAGEQADFRLIEADGATAGRVLDTTDYTFPTATTVKVTGDFTGIEVFGGLNYTFNYEFSEQFHRRRDGGAITTGRYQLRTMTVVYEDMAYFNTAVDSYGNGTGITEDIVTRGLANFTGKTLGAGDLILDSPVFGSGTYAFQIYGNSQKAVIQLTNDQPFGGNFVSATVEGFYTRRGR